MHNAYYSHLGDEVDEKELEHSSLQERLDMELKELDRKLEQKEVCLCCLLSLSLSLSHLS